MPFTIPFSLYLASSIVVDSNVDRLVHASIQEGIVGLSAKEAADQVGMSKQGIIKAIRTGKMSATKDLNGEWAIEPVELFRVYQPIDTQVDDGIQPDTASLQREIEVLRARLADKDAVIQAKEDVIRAKDETIEDLRRVTILLGVSQPPAKPRSFWSRLFQGV